MAESNIDDPTIVFDPNLATAWLDQFPNNKVVEKEYRPITMTKIIRIFQRKAEQGNIYLLGKRNKAVDWHCSNGVVNEGSRGVCLLSRLIKNTQLNIDFWVSALLGGSELVENNKGGDAFVA